jgi:PemK-like, MazF-like toxin of type II toxin-antitoxin system
MTYRQGEMLMLDFPINGQPMTYHPGIVVSGADIYEAEEFFYAVMLSTKAHNPQFSFELTKDMVTNPNGKFPSFVKCHIVAQFNKRDVNKRIGFLKEPYLTQLIERVKQTLFHGKGESD